MHFAGDLEASKSILNRLQIVASYFPDLNVIGDSQCDDVQYLKTALAQLSSADVDAGEGGTTFRFLVLRAARLDQITTIRAHKKLLQRPQSELLRICQQLGVQVDVYADRWVIHGGAWNLSQPICVGVKDSTQFVSSLILNSWLLPSSMEILLEGEMASRPYYEMTLHLMQELGMSFQATGERIVIPAEQVVQLNHISAEPDISSSFAIAALAAVDGFCWIKNFPMSSLQADFEFLEIFRKMGVKFELDEEGLRIFESKDLTPISYDLKNCPDLFPVLVGLLAQVDGQSTLFGAPHLRHKESDRIQGMANLLSLLGVAHRVRPDGIEVWGQSKGDLLPRTFDPLNDHRLVMAAQVLKAQYPNLEILNKNCVKKSFYNFWNLVEDTKC
ncbi:MAG: 3-phosphoshikimate 1-carboxyvinyltransferase [Bdellovibrionia bacterium]